MPHEVTAEQVASLRMHSQGLADIGFERPVDVARHLLALQAQDFGASQWALGVRTPDAVLDDITYAYDRGELVRSWPMRGTLHAVAAEDLRWMLGCTRRRMLAGARGRQRQLELDQATLDRARDIAVDVLSGGARLGREDFMAALVAGGIEVTGQRGYHLIWYLAQIGLVCWGPMHGNQQALVLLQEWVPQSRELAGDEASAEYARRYFVSHGPATLEDFVRWTKLTIREARAALASAAASLVELRCDGVSLWVESQVWELHKDADRGVESAVLLLPAFDEYLLGYGDRSHVLAPEHARRIVPGGNGIFLPTVVADGQVVGTWRRVVRAGGVTIETEPFGTFDEAVQQQIASAADRYAAFLGKPVRR